MLPSLEELPVSSSSLLSPSLVPLKVLGSVCSSLTEALDMLGSSLTKAPDLLRSSPLESPKPSAAKLGGRGSEGGRMGA